MLQEKALDKIKTHIMLTELFFFENRDVYEIMWKSVVDPDNHRRQYGAFALHAGYLRLQTHTQNM
jgi:hypothetical protein